MSTVADPSSSTRVPPGAFKVVPESAPVGAQTDNETASLTAPFERAFATLKRMTSNYATLAVLDARRAALQFAWLVAGGIVISVLVVTAWLAGVIALAVWLLGKGMSWPAVLLVAGALNLVGAVIVGTRIKHVFVHAPFSATLHQLKSDEPPMPTAGRAAGNAP